MQSNALPVAPVVQALSRPVAQARAEAIPIRTTFERYEVKYWMSAAVADRVVRFISPYVIQDPVSAGDVSHQRNTSLYFDTSGYLFWYLHTSSAHNRYKLRIRAYGDPPAGKAFFEVKRKIKDVMLKLRGTVPLDSVQDVLAGRLQRVPCHSSQRAFLETFLSLHAVYRVSPKLLVSYRRTPFISRHRAEDVRLTVDQDILYQPTNRNDLSALAGAWRPVPGPFAVASVMGRGPVLIELKFRGAAPCWMGELVQRFGLRRTAFSKYVAAVNHLMETSSPARRCARG